MLSYLKGKSALTTILNNTKHIGILGCGWLGQALAKKLISNHYKVKATTTRFEKLEALKKIGVNAYQIELKPDIVSGDLDDFLNDLDVLIMAVPPQLKKGHDYFYKALKYVFANYDLSALKKIIYISSTGVFADGLEKTYDENSKPNNKSLRGKKLIALEELVLIQNQLQHPIILRYGGLIEHNGRHPVHFLSGKENIPHPEAPVNLIEQSDAVNLLLNIVDQSHKSNIYHGVNPNHPTRQDYYSKKAKTLNLSPPKFDFSNTSKGKNVSSDLTQKILGFSYDYGI